MALRFGSQAVSLLTALSVVVVLAFPNAAFANSSLTVESAITTLEEGETTVIAEADVTLEYESTVYTAKALRPTVTVNKNGSDLTSGTDYSVAYADNKEAGMATVTVTGMGSYSGTVQKNFTITACDLSTCTVTVGDEVEFTGAECKPRVTVKTTKNGNVNASNYTVTADDNINVGTATVTIAPVPGKSLTGDSIVKSFSITQSSITDVTTPALFGEIDDRGYQLSEQLTLHPLIGTSTYTGENQSPTLPQLILFTSGGSGQTRYDLTSADYTTEGWTNNKNAGEASITLTGTGNFKGTLELKWKIEQKSLADDDVTVSGLDAQVWKDSPVTPPVPTVKVGDRTLVEGTDYDVTYGANLTDVGSVDVTITGKDNYTGTKSGSFNIVKSLNDATVTVAPGSVYTGEALTPAVTVELDGKTLTADENYTVTYDKNVNAGTATATVKGVDSYSGEKTVRFEIAKAGLTVPAAETGLVYNGELQTGVAAPVEGAGYTVAGNTGTDAGNYSATLTADANHEFANGSATLRVSWTIAQKQLSDNDVTVTGLVDQTWTGSAVTPPAPTVKVGERALVAGTDYDVTYGANLTDPGAVAVTIAGKGNYTGTASGLFSIVKAAAAKTSLATAEVTVAGGQVYTGKALTPAVTVKLGGVTLMADTDYTVAYKNNTNAGTATVTVTGAGDYEGAVDKTFSIARAQVAAPTAITGLVFNGKAQTGVKFATGVGYAVSGDTSATNAGSFKATAKLDANHAWTGGSTADVTVNWSIAQAPSSISLAAQTKTYTGKALAYSGKVTKSGSAGAVTYAYYSDAACKKAVKAADVKKAGTYWVKATVAAAGNYAAATSAAAKFTVAKATNPLAVKAASKTLKAAQLKKKAQSFKPSIVKKKGQGTLTYTKLKVNKKAGKFKVDKKTGKITVAKGTPKGTYTVQVKVKAAGNANYKALTKTAKVTVKVK